jgi:hypothetical protein
MTRTFLIAAGAALLASTGVASAQVYPDDPPGWAFQWRGIQQERGYHPGEYGGYGYGGGPGYGDYRYRGYGYYDRGGIVAPRRFYHRSPPGADIQDRGLANEHGYHYW